VSDASRQTVSVVVSTYRRLDPLTACLDGLRSQTRPAEEVIVVAHVSDHATQRGLEPLTSSWPELRPVLVTKHGSVAAYNRGLGASRGSIIAYIDDDAVPAADWLERIVHVFGTDGRIAAVGGRDMVVVDGNVLGPRRRRFPGRRADSLEVGRIQWFGRMIANHHVGEGDARDVDVLKGVNMSFVRSAVAQHGFDERLRGDGTQLHSELSICLPLRRRGLRVVYDPNIVVRHYPAPRGHGDDRTAPRLQRIADDAHNEALEVLDHLGPVQRAAFVVYGLVVGTTAAPGAAVLGRDVVTGKPAAWLRFIAAQRGIAAARRTYRTPRLVPEDLNPSQQPLVRART
jgi:GT2 family glycosyltransferase